MRLSKNFLKEQKLLISPSDYTQLCFLKSSVTCRVNQLISLEDFVLKFKLWEYLETCPVIVV